MQLPTFLRPAGSFALRDRRVLFLMGVIGFVTGYAGSQMAHTLPYARVDLGLTEGQMSAIFAGVRAVSLLGIAFSLVADRRGRRRPILLSYLLLVTGSLLTGFLPTTAAYAVAQALVRVGVVAIASLGIVLLAEEVSPPVRGYGLGLFGLAGSLGVGTGLLLLPIAERGPGAWRILFALGGLGLLFLPMLTRFLPESRAFRPAPRIPFVKALRMGLGRHFWPMAIIGFTVAAFSAPAFDFVLERLIDGLGWRAGAARFLLIVFSGLGTVGLLAGGRLADRRGRRITTATALLLGLAGGLAFYLLDSGWALAPAIFLATFGATMLTPAFGAQRAELFPTRVRATAGAWITNLSIVGSIFGFTVGGLLIDRYGLSTTVSLLGIGVLVAAVLALRLPETRGMDLVRSRARRGRTARRDPRLTPPPTDRSRPADTPRTVASSPDTPHGRTG